MARASRESWPTYVRSYAHLHGIPVTAASRMPELVNAWRTRQRSPQDMARLLSMVTGHDFDEALLWLSYDGKTTGR